MLVWFIHDRPGQAEGVALSLTETKYKLKWKQKFLRVQSLTYLVFLTLFFWKPNHLKTSPLQWLEAWLPFLLTEKLPSLTNPL